MCVRLAARESVPAGQTISSKSLVAQENQQQFWMSQYKGNVFKGDSAGVNVASNSQINFLR